MYRMKMSLAAALFCVATHVFAVKEISCMKDFEEIIKKGKPVAAKFHADWCSPCKQFKPTFDKVAGQMKADVTFVEVDVDANADIMNKYKVTGLPTILYFNEGKKVGKGGSRRTEKSFRQEIEETFDL